MSSRLGLRDQSFSDAMFALPSVTYHGYVIPLLVFSARILDSDISVLATWQVVLVVRDWSNFFL